jgi:hypothetical protein
VSEETEDTIVAASDVEMQDDGGDDAEMIAKKSKGFGYIEQDNS